MFRLINSHLHVYSLQVKSQDAAHTLGSQCVYISEICKYNLTTLEKLVGNGTYIILNGKRQYTIFNFFNAF